MQRTLWFIAAVTLAGCAGTQEATRSDSATSPSKAVAANPPPTLPKGDDIKAPDTAPLYFALDSTALTDADMARLRDIAAYAKTRTDVKVVIVGHADERGPSDYNLALGDARARTARDYLVRLGVQPDRITFLSKGEEDPADPGHDETAWAKNRRATFELRG